MAKKKPPEPRESMACWRKAHHDCPGFHAPVTEQQALWEPPRHPLDIAADPYRHTDEQGRPRLLCPSCGAQYGDQMLGHFGTWHAPWEQPDCRTVRRHRDAALVHLRTGYPDGWRSCTAQLRLAAQRRTAARDLIGAVAQTLGGAA